MKNMEQMLTITSIALAAGGAYCIYRYKKNQIASLIKKVDNFDTLFVKDWISQLDFENYNKSYTAVLLRGSELPSQKKLKFFFNTEKMAALCIYDQNNKKVVKREYFFVNNFSEEFGKEKFIEFPFEF